MKAQLYCFDGCPSAKQALENLRLALEGEQLPNKVETITVTSEEDAVAKRFIGSPTIRIDGVDVEGPEAEQRGYGFGCRVYSDGTTIVGWPSVDQIRQALQRQQASD